MDKRRVLEEKKILCFPGMECEIDSLVGRGSNAIVYLGRYQDGQTPGLYHQVLIKELFPYEPRGLIYRDEQDQIRAEPEAAETMKLHRLSFIRGNETHLKILRKYPGEVDANINTFELNQTLYSVLGFSGGRSMDKELNREPADRRVLSVQVRRIQGALNVLECFHDAGFLHLDISPDNILLIGEGKRERVTLIDYNSVHTLEEIRTERSVYYSAKEGYTAPEIRAGRTAEIGFHSDLYALTAVFYTCLTGKRLSAVQMIRSSIPDVSEAECLRGCPDTVVSMVRKILKRGLSSVLRRRYQSAERMREDLEELEDRINGKGITHWALWESGRGNIVRAVKNNKALEYIREEEKTYPLLGVTESGERVSLMDMEFVYRQSGGRPLLLLGGGGMGKTTAMMRMAYRQKKEYSAADPAVTYLSLFGWRAGERTYIRDRILEGLRFKPQTDSMETARHELAQLLSRPLNTKRGERPVLVLLLDGWNEAAGDTTMLQRELEELAGLGGVRIIVTSRSEIPGLDCQKIVLERLKREDARSALADHGLLPPDSMELFELLCVPMLLSMFINTALAGEKQLLIHTKEELLEHYFSAILEKELRGLPENARERWGVEAAVSYVLPEIAALIQRRAEALPDEALLGLIEGCYRELSRRPLTAVFPRWIGHVSDLRMGAETPDAWYGRVVLDILWRRLGLIVRDEQGNFRVPHQMLEEYLAAKSAMFHREFDREKRRQRNWKILGGAAGGAGAVILILLCFLAYNSNMVRELTRRQEQILKNESAQLAYASEIDLENGKRSDAIGKALSGLPSDQSDRPVVSRAIHALADALYVYQETAYRLSHSVDQESEIQDFQLSPDGSVLVTLDSFGTLRVYDTGTERERWRQEISLFDSDEAPTVRILESRNALLCVDEKAGASLFSLEDGETLWTIDYSEIEHCRYGFIDGADVSNDESVLVLRVEDRPENLEDYNRCQYLVFYDMETGRARRETGMLPIPLRCVSAEAGVFSDDDTTYIAVYQNYSDQMYYLVYVDVASGEVLRTPWVKGASDKSYRRLSLTYIPESEYGAGGVFLYLCEYNIRNVTELRGSTHVGFLPDGEESWAFYEECSQIETSEEVPLVLPYASAFDLIAGTQAVRINRWGAAVRTETFPRRAVYCGINEENGRVFLVFEDGSADILKREDFQFSTYGAGTFEFLTNGAGVLTDFAISAGRGSGKWDAPFAIMSGSGNHTVYLCEQTGDPNGTGLELPDWAGGYLSGRVYAFPGEERFLYLDSEYFSEKDEEGHLDIWYQILGAVYTADGRLADEFSFEAEFNENSFSGFSRDGSKLFFGEYIYDLASRGLTEPEGIDHDSLKYGSFQSVLTEDGMLSAAWNGTNVVWWLDGENPGVGVPFPEEGIDWSGSREEASASSQYRYALGKNGLMVIKGSEREASGDNPVSHFMIYSVWDDQWTVAEDVSSVRGDPYVAVADRERWIAAADWDNVLRVYDQASGEIVREFALNLNPRSISRMWFLLDDAYLLVEQCGLDSSSTTPSFTVIDIGTGETVFSYVSETGSGYSDIQFSVDEDRGLLYLMDANYRMTGLCVDTEEWEILYEIPALKCVLGGSGTVIVQEGYGALAQYPAYSREELIAAGERVLSGESWEALFAGEGRSESEMGGSKETEPETALPGSEEPEPETALPGSEELETALPGSEEPETGTPQPEQPQQEAVITEDGVIPVPANQPETEAVSWNAGTDLSGDGSFYSDSSAGGISENLISDSDAGYFATEHLSFAMPESWSCGISFNYYEFLIAFYCPTAMKEGEVDAGLFCAIYRLTQEETETGNTYLGYDGAYYYYLSRPAEYCVDQEEESFALYKEMYDSVPELAESMIINGSILSDEPLS